MTITVGTSARTSVPLGAAVPSLVRWGLSSDADLIFRALATFGPQSARALATDLGLPPARIDRSLAELHAVDAVTPAQDAPGSGRRPVTWASGPVVTVIASLRSRRLRVVDRHAQEQAHRRVVLRLVDQVAGAGIPLEAPSIAGLTNEHVRYLPNRTIARKRLTEYNDRLMAEQLTISTEQAFDAEAARTGVQLDRQSIAKGTRIQVLGVPPADGDALAINSALVDGKTYQYREALDVPMKLFILDRRVALLPMDPGNHERGYLDISHPGVVGALVALFQRHWATAADPASAPVPPILLSDREQALISLLALGHTDLSAAAELRISSRSVTNVLRRVMDRLGVENRFQLGLALGALRVAELPSLEPIISAAEPG